MKSPRRTPSRRPAPRCWRYRAGPVGLGSARVQLGLRKPAHHAEANLTVPGKTLHADAEGENMYAAIDLLADKLDRLILKHKEKQQDHHAPRVVTDAL